MNKKLLKLAKIVMKFSELKTDKGVLIINDELSEGIDVFKEDEGEFEPADDGEYQCEGKKIYIREGKIESISDIEEPVVEEPVVEEIKQEKEQPTEPTEPDEKDLKITELEGLLKDRDAVIEELTAKIKELEDKIAKPVEEPVKMNKVEKTNESTGALKYFEK